MLSIAPTQRLTRTRFDKSTLYVDASGKCYYELRLNPFGYRERGMISVSTETQMFQVREVTYYLPVNPFLFISEYLEQFYVYQNLQDAIFDQPPQIKALNFRNCAFLEFSGDMFRFSKQKYLSYCKAKYRYLEQLGCESLASIFFRLYPREIIDAKLYMLAPTKSKEAKRTWQPKTKSGPLDRFLKKK